MLVIVNKFKQFIHLLQLALGLLKKKKVRKKERKDERNVWAAIFITPTYNMILVNLKAAVSADAPVQHV